MVPSISDEIRQKIYKVQAISFRRRAKTTKQVFTEVDKGTIAVSRPQIHVFHPAGHLSQCAQIIIGKQDVLI